jgi:2-(1,2-epoxy-1,2-dihydrophenyl)acetyl-CoA isomerase
MIGDGARAVLSVDGAVAIITLRRSEQLNALDAQMHEALAVCLDAVEGNPAIRTLVLTGEGRAFSSGQDLGERAVSFAAGTTPDLRASLDTLYNPLLHRIANLPIPVVAAVNGMAFGAGAALAIACDITLAATSARFQFGFVNVGLGLDCGASWALPRLIGQQRAMDLALSGRPVDGTEAERIGLVARCVADDFLLSEAMNLAAQLAAKPPSALQAIKRQLRQSSHYSFDNALDAERDTQAVLGQSADYREAVLRFSARSKVDTGQ